MYINVYKYRHTFISIYVYISSTKGRPFPKDKGQVIGIKDIRIKDKGQEIKVRRLGLRIRVKR
jgi:hypothetical protein